MIVSNIQADCNVSGLKLIGRQSLVSEETGEIININESKVHPVIEIQSQNLPVFCKDLVKKTINTQHYLVISSNVNQIEVGAFKNSQVKSVVFGNNDLKQIPTGIFQDLVHLENVTLTNNNINSLAEGVFQNLPKLTTVAVNHEDIATINSKWFVNCPVLQSVDFSYNKIKVIPTGALKFVNPSIKPSINLSGNEIQNIENGAIWSENILLLNLTNNMLVDVNIGMLPNLKEANILLLSNNKLQCLSENAVRLLKLIKKVELYNNPIQDSCKLQEIQGKLHNLNWL